MTDEDTFMGFSDGLSQSGTLHRVVKKECRSKVVLLASHTGLCVFVPSGVRRGGDDSLRSSDLHPPRGCGFCPACGEMALPAEEFLGRLLIHTGSPEAGLSHDLMLF